MNFRKKIKARAKLMRQAENGPQPIGGDTSAPVSNSTALDTISTTAPVAPTPVAPIAPAPLAPDYSKMSISKIAEIIAKDWKNVYFGAKPYLSAMFSLGSITDNYGMDSGKSVVLYFLSNATTWRGPVAKAIKAELNKRIKNSR